MMNEFNIQKLDKVICEHFFKNVNKNDVFYQKFHSKLLKMTGRTSVNRLLQQRHIETQPVTQ